MFTSKIVRPPLPSPKINAGQGNPQWFIWTVKARISRLRKSHIVCVREPGQDPQNAPGAEVCTKVHTEKLCLHHLCLRKKTVSLHQVCLRVKNPSFFKCDVFMKIILFLDKPFSGPTAVLFVRMYSLLRTTIPRRRACLPHVDTTHLPFCCETSLMRKPGRTHPLGTVPTVAGKEVDHSLLA